MALDAILYINLAHRHDRAAHVLHEISKICDDPSRVHRIDAIQRTPGALGCGLSHIKALQFALDHPQWQNILVLEDDFTFHGEDKVTLRKAVETLLRYSPHMDIGLLSYNHDKFRGIPTLQEGVQKVMFSQTTSSYVIRRSYIPTLMQNMKEAMYDMERTGWSGLNCIDIHWTVLQPMGNWYALVPAVGYQYENFSDIEQRVTAYGC
jgi:glycosyl transferase family 25